jgi:hypothetical protein
VHQWIRAARMVSFSGRVRSPNKGSLPCYCETLQERCSCSYAPRRWTSHSKGFHIYRSPQRQTENLTSQMRLWVSYDVPPLSAGEFWNEVFRGGRFEGSGIGNRGGGLPGIEGCMVVIPPLVVVVDDDRRLKLEAFLLIVNSEWFPLSMPGYACCMPRL